jgi:putative transposase
MKVIVIKGTNDCQTISYILELEKLLLSLHKIEGFVAKHCIRGGLFFHVNYYDVSNIVQWLKETSSRVLLQEFAHLRKQFWGRHLWARGYLAVSSGTITDEMIEAYIAEQEGEPLQDDSRFVIDEDTKLPPSRR